VLDQVKKAAFGKGRISFISGKFNVLHPGHFRLFRYAKETTDYLIVGVLGDGHVDGLLLPEDVRLDNVLSTSWVDDAFVLAGTPQVAISLLQPDVVVKGKEYENQDNPEIATVEEYGGVIQFVSGDTRFSSLTLLEAELESFTGSVRHSHSYLDRHGVTVDRLLQLVKEFGNIRTLIIGDLIVDQYIDCDPVGLSSEDPTIVVTPILTQRFLGGAGIVAAHVGSMAGPSHFLSISGDDDPAKFAKEKLFGELVSVKVIPDKSRPTTVKTRYRAQGKTLLRVSDFRDHEIDQSINAIVLEAAQDLLPEIDLLIFSDFNYGLFSRSLLEELSCSGKKSRIMMVADSQSSSQLGDIGRFKEMFLLTPTEREARLATRNKHGGLVSLAEDLQIMADAKNVILTLGGEGIFVHAGSPEEGWDDDRLPALNQTPKDVAGAGDAFLVVSALTLAAGGSIWESAYLGSVAAGCHVSRVGNTPLRPDDLRTELNR